MYSYHLFVGDDEVGVFDSPEEAWKYADKFPPNPMGMCVVESYTKPH